MKKEWLCLALSPHPTPTLFRSLRHCSAGATQAGLLQRAGLPETTRPGRVTLDKNMRGGFGPVGLARISMLTPPDQMREAHHV